MKPSIIDLFNTSVQKYAGNTFLWEKTSDKFEPTTYKQSYEQVHQLAAGLLKLGVQKGHKIALLSEGCNAWILGELAILHTGAVNVPLSIKLEESNDLIFRLKHSEAEFVFVSPGQLKKIRTIIQDLPLIKKVILMGKQADLQENELLMSDLMQMGSMHLKENPQLVVDRAAAVKPDDLANISYTSGTTADPKGIMLTHRNYTANVEQALTLMDIPEHYRTLIILPLDHCFAHVAGFYSFMASGASVGTVQVGRSGQETLRNIPLNIKELQPNLLLSVPALAKNFKKNIESGIQAKGVVAATLFKVAMKMAYSYNKEGFNKGRGLQFVKKPFLRLFDKILFAKIRENFGGKLEFFIGGGALLDIDLQRFFYAIGIPMFQGYGLSEATPIISSNGMKHHKLGSSGYLVKYMDLKICDSEGNTLTNFQKGEIVIKGENVMAGYYKNPESTAQTVKDGWLYTGDMGYMDNDGFLYVTGRFKCLLIAGDGEKYSPEGIEEAFVQNSEFMEQVILHNNQSPYTTALIVPNKEALKRFVLKHHPHADWNSDEAKKLALQKLQQEINEYRKGGKFADMFPDRWLPSAVAVIGEAFSEQNGLVNSTMKIIRGKVEERYADRIEELYSPEGKSIEGKSNLDALR
jgi:long-chain acyl-CoA synthetase